MRITRMLTENCELLARKSLTLPRRGFSLELRHRYSESSLSNFTAYGSQARIRLKTAKFSALNKV